MSVGLDHAKRLVALGLNLLPLRPGTKRPDSTALGAGGWKYLQETRNTDAELEQWFGGGTPRDAGILLGHISGVVVIDTDNLAAEEWVRKAEEIGVLPATPMQTQTKDGIHRYYRVPEGMALPAYLKPADGLQIELKRDGHYVVAPGSTHPEGPVYKEVEPWPSSLDEVPILPIALLQTAGAVSTGSGRPRHQRPGTGRGTSTPPIAEVIREGNRNATLLCEAGRLRRAGWEENEIAGALITLNEARCQPPLDEREVHGIARSVTRYAAADRGFPQTDSGNAEAFAAAYGHMVRYDHARKEWMIFGPHHWRVDADGAVNRLLLALIRERQAITCGSDSKDREDVLRWLLKAESAPRRRASLDLARSLAEIATDGAGWDRDPWMLGVANGAINLRTGEFGPGRAADATTLVAPVAYDPTATCPRWRRFLQEIFADYPDLPEYVQRVVGYTLTANTAEQCFWILYGTGANGKSTLIETLQRHVFGPYATTMPFPSATWSDAMSEYQKAELAGKRLVTSSEVVQQGRLNEEVIKSLTGGDTIAARHPYGRPFTYVPVAKFFFRVNDKPQIRDESHGMWRRIRLVPFTQTFPEPDPTLPEELAKEAPGILRWAVEGCLAWQAQGLGHPACVDQATRSYQSEQDSLSEFLAECCTEGFTARVKAGKLFNAYQAWADGRGQPHRDQLTLRAFGEKCKARFESKRTGDGIDYLGIGLRAEGEVCDALLY
jgi:putative DNA primase/helicase